MPGNGLQIQWVEHYLLDQGQHAKELISRLRERMVTFGVMDELATDGATVYTSTETKEFLKRFGIRHRVSSAYNPHSNQMAEGAIKAAKRMLRENTGAFGTLDTDKFLAALLTHRNKPDPKTSMSSSDVVFGRKIKDLMLIKPGQIKVNARWTKLLRQWEAVMAKRLITHGKELNKHTRELKPLNMGDAVSIQNGHGNKPLRWDNTGRIVEVAALTNT